MMYSAEEPRLSLTGDKLPLTDTWLEDLFFFSLCFVVFFFSFCPLLRFSFGLWRATGAASAPACRPPAPSLWQPLDGELG